MGVWGLWDGYGWRWFFLSFGIGCNGFLGVFDAVLMCMLAIVRGAPSFCLYRCWCWFVAAVC